ncbi:hypothetical protein EVAR_11586_1 [Eumeta japonica]|uniref:Uncharacterized protein n=1 Tax=Eumeta variegata TaxID=151549 RepID=A0A4C1X3J1_EUMVA|nr:hypothetical protein EVAR_11586_1 [Eumeta japonica]
MNLKYLFFVQVFTFPVQFADSNLKSALDVAQVGLKVVQAIVGVSSAITNYESQKRVKVLLEELVASSRRIESTIRTEAQRIIDELSVEINMQKVHNFKITVDDINLRYNEEFWKYFMSNITYETETIERFVNDRDVFKQLRRSIRYATAPTNLVAGVKDDRLFEILNNYLIREANNNRHCELGISHYKILYETYNTAVSAVVKATVMILYSYKYLQQGDRVRLFVRIAQKSCAARESAAARRLGAVYTSRTLIVYIILLLLFTIDFIFSTVTLYPPTVFLFQMEKSQPSAFQLTRRGLGALKHCRHRRGDKGRNHVLSEALSVRLRRLKLKA